MHFVTFVNPDTILWFKESIVIFFLTFIHEDAAILAAGFSKVENVQIDGENGYDIFIAYKN